MLDCFSGAGGLGLEAASRGASQVTLVDANRLIAENLKKECQRLCAEQVRVENVDILSFLDTSIETWDLVFIDPPYAEATLRSATLEKLISRNLLNPGCKIYLEWPRTEKMGINHGNLFLEKEKTAGQVVYAIALWGGSR